MAIKTSIARWVAGSTVAAVALWSVSALAAAPPPPVPASLTQQGRILDKDGTPVSSKVAITFTLYNHPTKSAAANTLWTETQNLTLDDGYFSAQLGNVTALDPTLFDGSVLYLGVTVGSDDEMTPRQAVTSVPYAFKAGTAAAADVAALATAMPFTGLTGMPAACAAGQFLQGYKATGEAICAAPVLSCTPRSSTSTAGISSAVIACNAGEVMTGGGCYSTVPLISSYQNDVCVPRATFIGTSSSGAPSAVSPAIASVCNLAISSFMREQICTTQTTGTLQAYATCCTIQ
jgi:hypothetical protein